MSSSAHPRDLETIVTLLELAALDFTNEPGDRFTADALWARAVTIVGEDFGLVRGDFDIVLRTYRGLRAHGGDVYSLR